MRTSIRASLTLPPQDFGSRFEVLGENCEPGIMQRAFGAEPLGLFRFAGGSIRNIVDVIETEGRHLFSADDIAIDTTADGEYMIRSRWYNDFPFHTHVYEKDVGPDEFLQKRLPIVAYLKARFFSELRDGEKIFLRMGADSIVELRQLHRALNRHKPRVLLSVTQGDTFHPPGTIERIGRGLWRGHIAYFKDFAKPEPVDLANWLSILSGTSSRTRPGFRCAPNRRLGRTTAWAVVDANAEPWRPDADGPFGVAGLLVKEGPAEHRLFARLDVPLSLPEETLVVFSTRVWLDNGFAGYVVRLDVEGVTSVHQVVADPARRGCWQPVWVTAKIPARQERVTLGIRAVAWSGSRMLLGSVAIEAGAVPGVPRERVRVRPAVIRRATTMFASVRRRWAPRTVAQIAQGAIAVGAFIEADDVLATALAETPDDVALVKLYATSAHNSGRFVAAIGRWQRARDLAPEDAMCCAALACNFREYGVLDRAHSVISAGLYHFPDDPVILSEAARIAYARERNGEAVVLYDRAIRLHGAHGAWIAARDQAKEAEALQAQRDQVEASPGIEPGCKDLQSSA